MTLHNLTVGIAHVGLRLDVYLAQAELGLSRRRIRQIIDVGGVYIDNKRIRIASRQVMRGEKVRIEYSEMGLKQLKNQKLEFFPQDILHEGQDFFAMNKPPGMPAQATRDQSIMHVVPCLEALLKTREETRRRKLILVHRLDKETTGLMLVADGDARATWLTEQFKARLVEKTYWAVCYGIPKDNQFIERAHLSEIDKRTGNVRPVHSGGRSAVTNFKVLAVNLELGLSLLECKPETGRSHQIRVHLEVRNLPIVGDKRYGAGNRRALPSELTDLAQVHHLLHAKKLRLVPAEGAEPLQLEAPLPERFAQFLAAAKLIPSNP